MSNETVYVLLSRMLLVYAVKETKLVIQEIP